MFGLISKKKIIKAVQPLADQYSKAVTGGTERERLCKFYYNSGNCNAINAITYKLGIKLKVHPDIKK